MSLSAPRTLDVQHRLDEFDCGKPALTDWLRRHARQAIDASAEAFYRRFGFQSTPTDERQLILLLKDARRYAAGPANR